MKVVTIIGTRPEIIKMSPLIELLNNNFSHVLLHSGQHYDPELDDQLFRKLKLPKPDVRLKTGSGDFAIQLSKQLKGIFNFLTKFRPDYVLVQGDTNTALSGALAATRLGIRVIHIESGCRSGNINAPEEQNRILIDSISSRLLCSDKKSLQNLINEKKQDRALLVGSTTFDALKRSIKLAPKNFYKKYNLRREAYALVTLHRAESMVELEEFRKKIDFLNKVSEEIPIIFCVHPRTNKYIQKHKIKLSPNIIIEKPLEHLEFISLLKSCRFVLSDSGGIQEEAAYFNRPCLVLRKETEWTRLTKIKKNYLLKTMSANDLGIVKKLIHNNDFYNENRSIKCSESTVGAAKRIIKEIRAL